MEVEDKATNEWLNDQKTTTGYTYKTIWSKFTDYVKMNGDQILASKKADTEHLWEEKVKAFIGEMRKTLSSNYAKSMVGCIRSFFDYHRVPLTFRKQVSKKLTEASRITRDYKFTKAELYKMSQVGDLIDKYVVCAGKSFGLRAIDFMALTRSDLESYIDREVPIAIGETNTIKENVKAFPFIDSDAQPVIKLMLEKMNAECRTKPTDKILTFGKNQLTARLQNLAKKIGINNNGKLVRFHCLRKFLIDRLKNVMSESAWKQIVGKAVPEEAYVSEQGLREAYQRVMSDTCFNTTNKVSDKKLEALELENEGLRKQVEALRLEIGLFKDSDGKLLRSDKTILQRLKDLEDKLKA